MTRALQDLFKHSIAENQSLPESETRISLTFKLLTLSITAKIVNVELFACLLFNPFENLCRSQTQSDHSDTHYNAELSNCFEDISAISNLLNNCSRFKTVNDFNNSLKLFKNESFSVFFKISIVTKQT